MRSPRTTKHDIVLAVVEVGYQNSVSTLTLPFPFPNTTRDRDEHTTISRIKPHSLKPLLLLQRRGSPLPQPAHLRLSGQLAAVGRHGHGVPVRETYVRGVEVCEEGVGIQAAGSAAGD